MCTVPLQADRRKTPSRTPSPINPGCTPHHPVTHAAASVRLARRRLARIKLDRPTSPCHDAHTIPPLHRPEAPECPAGRFSPDSTHKTPRSSPPSPPLAPCSCPDLAVSDRRSRIAPPTALHVTTACRHHPPTHIATRPTPTDDYLPKIGRRRRGSLKRAPSLEMAARPQPTT